MKRNAIFDGEQVTVRTFNWLQRRGFSSWREVAEALGLRCREIGKFKETPHVTAVRAIANYEPVGMNVGPVSAREVVGVIERKGLMPLLVAHMRLPEEETEENHKRDAYSVSFEKRDGIAAEVRGVLAEYDFTAQEEIAILVKVIEAIAREAFRLPPEIDVGSILREVALACSEAAA